VSTALFSAAPRKSLVTHVEDEIRSALIEGRLEPGTRLVTKDLAETLGMSITPVREALVRFAASGVLTAEPAQSFRVPTITVAQYSEIAEIRKSVEGLAASNATTQITPDELSNLENMLSLYLAAKTARDQHLALTRNKEFRFSVYAAARMPTLLSVIETLWLRAGPGFNYLYPDDHTVFSEHHNYDDLLAALRARDAEGARKAIENAIDDGAKRVIGALQAREKTVSTSR
jgi:GntR family colanic acid and biofilm gene transcriptional regulator